LGFGVREGRLIAYYGAIPLLGMAQIRQRLWSIPAN
jgi:hypothetical protein